jgi:hypothetical protein
MPTTIQNGYYWSEFLLNIVRSAPAEVTAIPNHIGFGRAWQEWPDLVLIMLGICFYSLAGR